MRLISPVKYALAVAVLSSTDIVLPTCGFGTSSFVLVPSTYGGGPRTIITKPFSSPSPATGIATATITATLTTAPRRRRRRSRLYESRNDIGVPSVPDLQQQQQRHDAADHGDGEYGTDHTDDSNNGDRLPNVVLVAGFESFNRALYQKAATSLPEGARVNLQVFTDSDI